MKAVRIHQFGSAEGLILEDVPEPIPDPGQALIRVRACALNHLDLWVRNGVPAYRTPLPHILGSDIAGEMAQDCGEFKAGDPVILHPVLSCWRCETCISGHDNICRNFGILGAHTAGGYAQYLTVDARNLVRKPEHLSWTEAASVPLVFLTAHHMLLERAKLQAGETVAVLAAGSGVGIAAIQIAKLAGATVIAIAGTDQKLERARDLGADFGVNYTQPDWGKQVRSFAKGVGPDVVVEHVGEATFPDSVRMLKPGGRLVTCGATTGTDSGFDIRVLFSKELNVLGSMLGCLRESHRVAELFSAGKLRPVVDTVFPLEQARAAHEKLEQRSAFGKVVLEIP